jgi:hypothetical protein
MFVKDILRFAIFLFMTIVVFSGTFLLVLKAENTLQLHEETMQVSCNITKRIIKSIKNKKVELVR